MRKKVDIDKLFTFDKNYINISMSCMKFTSDFNYKANSFNFPKDEIGSFIDKLPDVMLEYSHILVQISDGRMSKHFKIKNDGEFIEEVFLILMDEINNLTDFAVSEKLKKRLLMEFDLSY